MSTMIAQPGRYPHPHGEPHPDALARRRRDRLARASAQDMESALAFLSVIDPEAFEIALTAANLRVHEVPEDAATPEEDDPEEDEPFPVCRHCGAPVGIFPDHGLRWQHFRGDAATSGTQQIYDPGHPAEATWLLPGEAPGQTPKKSSQQVARPVPRRPLSPTGHEAPIRGERAQSSRPTAVVPAKRAAGLAATPDLCKPAGGHIPAHRRYPLRAEHPRGTGQLHTFPLQCRITVVEVSGPVAAEPTAQPLSAAANPSP